jgi:hypothetical protein
LLLDVGIFVGGATVHLHGDVTAIHSNKNNGIYATGTGKVLIHLPSDHNTTYNNGTDLDIGYGGIITNVDEEADN